jgi:hypothetical protein
MNVIQAVTKGRRTVIGEERTNLALKRFVNTPEREKMMAWIGNPQGAAQPGIKSFALVTPGIRGSMARKFLNAIRSPKRVLVSKIHELVNALWKRPVVRAGWAVLEITRKKGGCYGQHVGAHRN